MPQTHAALPGAVDSALPRVRGLGEPGFLDYLLLGWTPVLGLLRRPAIPL